MTTDELAIESDDAVVDLAKRRGLFFPANEAYDTRTVDTKEVEFRYAGEVIGVHRMLRQ